MTWLRQLLPMLAGLGLLSACGSDSDDSEPTGGSSQVELFPNAPECMEGFIRVAGTLAGEAYQGGSFPSDWSALDITFGVGETDGSSFGSEYELRFAEKLSLGKKVGVTGGYLYVTNPQHTLATQYICIQAGEVALVQSPPEAETVLIEFELTQGALGQACDGAAIEMSLNGCISRTSTYVP